MPEANPRFALTLVLVSTSNLEFSHRCIRGSGNDHRNVDGLTLQIQGDCDFTAGIGNLPNTDIHADVWSLLGSASHRFLSRKHYVLKCQILTSQAAAQLMSGTNKFHNRFSL